ncbi:MAG TPA: DinB family protein [Dehalococcoidia bacterium]|nr:DinB family protein [Dehalococcoidia bacterium]
MTVEALSSTADLEDAREKLVQSFAPVREMLDEPNVVGAWSIRQTLAHLLAWDGWAEETLAALERGEAVPIPAEDAMNTNAVEAVASLSADTLMQRLLEARRLILGRLAAMTDEERRERRYVLADKQMSANDFVDSFIEHDLEHASEIRAWRKAKGL